MAGQAGNVSAFNTVWTYDIYKAVIARDATDEHLVWMGRVATVVGILLSIGTAYVAMQFNTIMDYIQAIFSWVNAPLFATMMLGMFWNGARAHGCVLRADRRHGQLVLDLPRLQARSAPAGARAARHLPRSRATCRATCGRRRWGWLVCFAVTLS